MSAALTRNAQRVIEMLAGDRNWGRPVSRTLPQLRHALTLPSIVAASLLIDLQRLGIVEPAPPTAGSDLPGWRLTKVGRSYAEFGDSSLQPSPEVTQVRG
jgi:hypothetical protein